MVLSLDAILPPHTGNTLLASREQSMFPWESFVPTTGAIHAVNVEFGTRLPLHEMVPPVCTPGGT